MTPDDESSSRAELARWFIDHDEVDEAARVLAPGDELVLGKSDFLDLAAALGRRGLAGELRASPRARAGARGDAGGAIRHAHHRPTPASAAHDPERARRHQEDRLTRPRAGLRRARAFAACGQGDAP
jgi:hypothetical protein